MNFSKPAPWGNVMTKHRLKSTLCVLKVAIINSTPPPQYLIWIHSVYLGCGQVFRALIIDAYPLTNRAIFFFGGDQGNPALSAQFLFVSMPLCGGFWQCFRNGASCVVAASFSSSLCTAKKELWYLLTLLAPRLEQARAID